MAITAAQVVVSNVAIALNPADTGPSGGQVHIRNTHATDVLYLGPSTVTAGNGYPLPASTATIIDMRSGEVLFGIRGAAADITAGVLRLGD